jgi:alkaline phosphatase D
MNSSNDQFFLTCLLKRVDLFSFKPSLSIKVRILLSLLFISLLVSAQAKLTPHSLNNVKAMHKESKRKLIIVTIDGLRWQEVFTGASLAHLNSPEFNARPDYTKETFWHDNLVERRNRLMPFTHSIIAKQGVLVGDRNNGSFMNVSNKQFFSYPGYNEIFTGVADERIGSNRKQANKNQTFLEWLNQKPKYRNKIGIFSGWDVFPYIFNTQRSGLMVNAGFEPFLPSFNSAQVKFLNQLQAEIPSPWHNVRHDAFTYGFAKEYLLKAKPEVLVINLGETDDFAHNGKYDAYLTSAKQTDAYLQDLWQTLQQLEGYQDNTNLLVITDHGRGGNLDDWQHHASVRAIQSYMESLTDFTDGIVGADHIWFAAIGPDIKPLGLLKTERPLSQNQFAATALTSFGFDASEYNPQAGKAISQIFKTQEREEGKVSNILFGSCSHQDKDMPIFDAILQDPKDAFIFLGDNIYGDTEDMQVLTDKYAKLGAKSRIQTLKTTTNVFAIWDDHDYGENDAGKEYPFKDESKEIMLDFWDVPQDSPRRTRPDGLYGSYVVGQGQQAIRVILPDLRYQRDALKSVGTIAYLASRKPENMGPYEKSPGSMLGETQWQWLEDELQKPEPIKIIGSSLQVLSDYTGWEAWGNFDDKKRLFELIDKHGVNGVLMISGDTHWGEISKDENAVAYPLFDITSSGLTEEWKQVSPNKHRLNGASAEVNYGFVSVQWLEDPEINAGLKDINGDIVMQTRFMLSEISAY